jgi:hypothetical protein
MEEKSKNRREEEKIIEIKSRGKILFRNVVFPGF